MLKTNFPLQQDRISSCYIEACRLEVRSLKPGNVHIFSEGHGMTVEDFNRSAEITAPFLSDPNLPIGTRILKSVEATINILHTNTNLGIVLLCAPIAAAAGPLAYGEGLLERIVYMLSSLRHSDACEVYKAISIAQPAGLGKVSEGDVANVPPSSWTLLDAMKASAHKDMIAAQYERSFSDIVDCSNLYQKYFQKGAGREEALSFVYLQKLSEVHDTHIVRKHGIEKAEWVRKTSQKLLNDLNISEAQDLSSPTIRGRLLTFDQELKMRGYNPGSLADIMCASAFFSQLINTHC